MTLCKAVMSESAPPAKLGRDRSKEYLKGQLMRRFAQSPGSEEAGRSCTSAYCSHCTNLGSLPIYGPYVVSRVARAFVYTCCLYMGQSMLFQQALLWGQLQGAGAELAHLRTEFLKMSALPPVVFVRRPSFHCNQQLRTRAPCLVHAHGSFASERRPLSQVPGDQGI